MRKALTGPFVWTGQDLKRNDSWIIPWTDLELGEIDNALEQVKRCRDSWRTVCKDDFPLTRVRDKLSVVAEELENGRGVVKLAGLPIERYSQIDLRYMWMGLGQHLGRLVYQDCDGQIMRDIRDEATSLGERYGRMANPEDGSEFLSSKARTYSNAELRFHTDRTDVVGLLAVQQARSGGLSKIASTGAVHNAMLERRPDLLELLYQPIYRSRLGEERGGEAMIYPLPVFGLRDGKLTSHYSRTYIEAAQLLPETPRMSAAQWDALDLLVEIADELCYRMTLRPGDIQLLNNHVVYHARTPFTDDPDASLERLLLRLWLCMPGNRALPPDHAVLWGDVEADMMRGGIQLAEPH